MGIGGFFITYSDGGGLHHKFSKYVSTSDESGHWLAGDGTTIALATATLPSSNDNAGTMIRAFLKAYEFVAPTGSQILSLNADWRDTGGPGVVDGSATFNWSGFTPNGGVPSYGPFPTGFAAFRSRAVTSRRAAWLRMYSTGNTLYSMPTVFDPNDIDPDFSGWLTLLATPGAGNGVYVTWSGFSSTEGDWQGIAPYQIGLGRIGAKNG